MSQSEGLPPRPDRESRNWGGDMMTRAARASGNVYRGELVDAFSYSKGLHGRRSRPRAGRVPFDRCPETTSSSATEPHSGGGSTLISSSDGELASGATS